MVEELEKKLIQKLRSYESCAVAFSGGVDSAVVVAAAHRALGENAVALTGIGAAVSADDLQAVHQVIAHIGARSAIIPTTEIEDANYQRNDAVRCFHCKTHLYRAMRDWIASHPFKTIASGTNFDDLGDYRPGLKAAEDFEVKMPLVELQMGKSEVRALAEHWGLPNSKRLASPCLASRIAYGQTVTPERLRRIEAAESWLKERGLADVRVRLHADELVRVEIDFDHIATCLDVHLRNAMVAYFHSLGFRYVTLDLAGRQSGSLNRALPVLHS